MKKILIIDNGNGNSLFDYPPEKKIDAGNVFTAECSEILNIIDREKPDFILTDFKEPVNGNDDVLTILQSLDGDVRLRVTLLSPAEMFTFFVRGIYLKIQKFFNGHSGKPRRPKQMTEAFVRR